MGFLFELCSCIRRKASAFASNTSSTPHLARTEFDQNFLRDSKSLFEKRDAPKFGCNERMIINHQIWIGTLFLDEAESRGFIHYMNPMLWDPQHSVLVHMLKPNRSFWMWGCLRSQTNVQMSKCPTQREEFPLWKHGCGSKLCAPRSWLLRLPTLHSEGRN